MRQIILSSALLDLLLLTSSPAYADHFKLKDGLIYDKDIGLVWLQDADLAATNTLGITGINADGSMNWYTAQDWIAAINTENYLGFSNWRLPTTPGNNTGYTSEGEMGHLYYTELGNSAGGPLTEVGPFANLQNSPYWTGTDFFHTPPQPDRVWTFYFFDGRQQLGSKELDNLFVLPVADRKVVPEPSALALIGYGWHTKISR